MQHLSTSQAFVKAYIGKMYIQCTTMFFYIMPMKTSVGIISLKNWYTVSTPVTYTLVLFYLHTIRFSVFLCKEFGDKINHLFLTAGNGSGKSA